MNNIKVYTNLLSTMLLFFIVGCTSNVSTNDEEQAIKDTLTEMWDAIEKEDVDRYASYVHQDFTQFGETRSKLDIGKQKEVDGIREWVRTSENIHTEMIDPKVTIKDDIAWITYYWSDKGTTNGKPFASKGKSTRIFVKEDGKWMCIHGHYTLL